MWPFKKKTRPSRLDAKRAARAAGATWWRRLRDAASLPAAATAVVFCIAALVMDAWPLEPFPYRLGQYVPNDIRARTGFKVLSQARLENAVARAKESTPATFRLNAEFLDEIVARLRTLPEKLKATSRPASIDETLAKLFGPMTGEALSAWRSAAEGDRKADFETAILRFREKLSGLVVVAPTELRAQRERSVLQVRLVGGGGHGVVDLTDVLELGSRNTGRLSAAIEPAIEAFDAPIRSNVRTYVLGALSGQRPTYRYDKRVTDRSIREAELSMRANPPEATFDFYERGDLLVERSRRSDGKIVALDQRGLDLLACEHAGYLSRKYGGPLTLLVNAAGRAVLVLFITSVMCFYVFRYQHEIVAQVRRGITVAALLLLMLLVNKALVHGLRWNPHTAILPVLMAAIVLTIAYDQRFALAIGSALAVLIVLQLRADISTLLLLVAGMIAVVFQLREIRTRSRLVVVSCITAGVVVLVVFALAVSTSTPWPFALLDALWAGGFALLAGFLVQGILPLLERAFRTATSMTLLEYCDASKPLLKRLAMDAPGTYNHSLQLGSMCEAAAESVGARGLLARVGAYYHDIGKTNKPDYFVENQSGSSNKHAKLSPAMSLLIIIGHVKDGLEMAREYGLPQVLHEFIATHHGTTLVQYFYHAATEQRKNGTDRAPDEVEFRYPGPKPHSREAAILMLADASESSVRAMSEPTPGRIENQVHTMVNRRLMDGQLDNCELTLNEVHRIEQSLVKSLCGIYHGRIAYPTPVGEKPSAAEIPRSGGNGNSNGSEKPEQGPIEAVDS